MNTFNVIVGIVAVLAALFALYVFVDTKRKEAVETQKAAEYQQRLADLMSMANSIAKQGTLIASLADRESVTKNELKHLIIAQLSTIESLQASVSRTHSVEQRWRFGMPATYRTIPASPEPTEQQAATGA